MAKKLLTLTIIITAILLVREVGRIFLLPSTTKTPLVLPSSPSASVQKESLPPTQATKSVEPQKTQLKKARVKAVIDGDTIILESNEKVRLIGIDAPESSQNYYKEALDRLKELIDQKEVALEKDVSERDKYGRLLRYIWLNDTLINLQMIEEGLAVVATYPPDVKYQDRLIAAQKAAQSKKIGLWSDSQPAAKNTPCLIKGNISASGEKIYHLPGGAYYDKTSIDESKGERWFCSEEEAQAAGWRKSKL